MGTKEGLIRQLSAVKGKTGIWDVVLGEPAFADFSMGYFFDETNGKYQVYINNESGRHRIRLSTDSEDEALQKLLAMANYLAYQEPQAGEESTSSDASPSPAPSTGEKREERNRQMPPIPIFAKTDPEDQNGTIGEKKQEGNMNKESIHTMLADTGYCSTDEIDYSVLIMELCGKPLLIEGDPGTGKTALAQAVAKGMSLPLVRVQMYEGLTDDKIMYDYDYPKQLLALEAIKPIVTAETDGMDANTALQKAAAELDFYGREFMIERPVLRAINGKGRKVILFDEIDKAPEQIEYMLYEFLENYSITIPQYGEIACPENQRPLVFLTSNGYRNLSGALKRRCAYLYINRKTKTEMIEILMAKAGVDEKLADDIAACLCAAMDSGMRQPVSISEGIDWANYLKANGTNTREMVLNSLGMLVKNQKDMARMRQIVTSRGEVLWSEQ